MIKTIGSVVPNNAKKKQNILLKLAFLSSEHIVTPRMIDYEEITSV
jgi:hypothetical protein